jgi:hypothetical protein
MLVEPNNHRVNATERMIHTFKDHFVSALATTDSEFPLQLWDCLAPHVETSLNMLRPSRIDSTKLAYEVIHGPYDWNRFPLPPPGCKAIIKESPRPEHCGVAVEPTLGMLVLCWTITVAIIILSQKHVHTAFPVQRNCSLNTVRSHFQCGTNICKKLLMSCSQRSTNFHWINGHVFSPKFNSELRPRCAITVDVH